MNTQSQVDLLRFQLRKKEATARAIPYISFILTHAALVLFLLLSFFMDSLLGSGPYSLTIKIALAVLAVLLLASEWIYAIVNSRRWKKDIQLLLLLEEEQRHQDEQERLRRQEELIAAEQLKNRVLMANLQRQRGQVNTPQQGPSFNARSARPARPAPSYPLNSNGVPYPSAPADMDNLKYPFHP